MSCWSGAVGHELLVSSCWSGAVGHELLVMSCWSGAVGQELLALTRAFVGSLARVVGRRIGWGGAFAKEKNLNSDNWGWSRGKQIYMLTTIGDITLVIVYMPLE
jgi:hypothetical protein